MSEIAAQGELFARDNYYVEQQNPEDMFFPQGVAMQQLCDGQLRRPGAAYGLYVRNRVAMGLEAPNYFFSTTITTGGFLRRPETPFAEGMALNHQLARGLADAVVDQFGVDPKSVVLPSDLGKVAGWSQADFLLFWGHVIYGTEEHAAEALDKKFEADYYQTLAATMSNPNFSTELRRQAYSDMMRHMEEVILSNTAGVYDRPLLVPLVDDEFSLGCFGEHEWRPKWRNPLSLWHSEYEPGDVTPDIVFLRMFPELAGNWRFGPQHPATLTDIANSLSEQTSKLVSHAQLLGASVMGETYDQASAQMWADYYDGILVET